MKPVGVLLAAGNSSRFGSNKLAHPLSSEETIGLNSARKLISELDECVAVVRKVDIQLADQLNRLGFTTIFQQKPEAGMGNSLSLAIKASSEADGWLISLADMPWIKNETLRLVIDRLISGAPIIAPVFNGQRGHPVGFNNRYRDNLMALDGDVGARQILSANAEFIQHVKVNDPGILRDVDTREDLDTYTQ